MLKLFQKINKANISRTETQACPSDEHIKSIESLNLDSYIIVDWGVKAISVFDDLHYDRSDLDVMAPGMRRYVKNKLESIGFAQISGCRFKNEVYDIVCEMPKLNVKGASPFDATNYIKKREYDLFIMTPTQLAAHYIDSLEHAEAVEKIMNLVHKHPVNLFKIMDFVEDKVAHQNFLSVIHHIINEQKKAIKTEPLCRLKSLK
ncbi:hypothetical protein [Agarilytica rhodophyticola]|uniref:hypothetical protein n=1 Tax=Agarilytica rhodophyticola TaxID=1737490 RepID=UPI000B345F38|nr:hypothetical protein [Agarilytica rhodophyticola]